MAQENINYGTSENDGTGDKLRDAFKKTDDNFTDVYNTLDEKINKDQTSAQSLVGRFTFDEIAFDIDTPQTGGIGTLKWNDTDGTLDLGLKGGTVNLQIGQETVMRVQNNTGSEITNGMVVYILDAGGFVPRIALADANMYSQSFVVGITTESIAHGSQGYVTMTGTVRDMNTGGMTEGHPLWLSEESGQYTQTRPTPPAMSVFLGYVTYAHANNGMVVIRPVLVPRLSGLSDTYGTPQDNEQYYKWNETSQRFELAQGIGHKDSFGTLGSVLVGASTYTPRLVRSTKIALPHVAKGDVFTYKAQLNHDKRLNVNLDGFHIHIIPIGEVTAGQKISFTYAYQWCTNGDVFQDTLPITGSAEITLLDGQRYKYLIKPLIIDIVYPEGESYSSEIFLEFTRKNDASDTYPGEFALVDGDVHYISNQFGSKYELSDSPS